MLAVEFTKIAIIESLKEPYKSGSDLKGYIEGLNQEYLPYVPPIYYFSVINKDEFKCAINSLIAESSQKGENFILHLEIHGLDDLSGIGFKDTSTLSWEELGKILVPLNRAMGFNLLVCMATCFGSNLLKVVKPCKPGPCLAVIGPTESTDGSELLQHYRHFYRELLDNLDLVNAFKYLTSARLEKGGFICKTADIWFEEVIMDHMNGYYLDEEILDERVNEIMLALPQEYNYLKKDVIVDIIKTITKNYIKKSFETFFMAQDIPENSNRFHDTLKKIEVKTNLV